MATGNQKFVRLFDRNEIHLTACAVTKRIDISSLLGLAEFGDYYGEPNQFWKRDPRHERALLKVSKRDPKGLLTYWDPVVQIFEIPMMFWGSNSNDGWGELQFLIKEPRLVILARRRSFDTRVNRWVEETKIIQPKNDLGTHAYLALRFYHQDYLPPVPGDWHFEPVYVSVKNSAFYRIEVLWRENEITVVTTMLNEDSPEISKHLK